MSDLQKYINKRNRTDQEFAEGFEVGYAYFKIGVMLRQARERIGLTQEEAARSSKPKNPPARTKQKEVV